MTNLMLKLLLHIVRSGKLRHTGFDFSERRARSLEGLKPFLPPGYILKKATRQFSHPVLRMLVAEAAYLKSSFGTRANHLSLSAPALSYIRIPRSASTALCKAMLEHQFPDLKGYKLSSREINHLADAHTHRVLPGEDKGNVFFSVVRNPFARIVSVYRQFFESVHDSFLYDDYMFGIFKRQMSFKDFIRIVREIPDALKDQHLKPQHRFLSYYKKSNTNVHILKLEEPDLVSAYLEKYGLKFEAFNRDPELYDYRQYYDRQVLEKVREIYRKDLSQFGYMDIYGELKSYL